MTRQHAVRTLAAIILVLILIPLGLPLALGTPARRAYQDLVGAALGALPGSAMLDDRYEQGWFGARATTELTLPGTARLGAEGPGQGRLRIDSRIEYGPRVWFDGTGTPPLASVETRVEWLDPEIRLPPLLIRTQLEVGGSAQARVTAGEPPDHPAPGEGLRIVGSGLSGTVHFNPGETGLGDRSPPEFRIDLDLPGLALLAPGGTLASLTQARLKAEARGWVRDLYTGSARLELGSAELGGTIGAARGPEPAALRGVSLAWSQAPAGRTLDLRLELGAHEIHLGPRVYRAAAVQLSAGSLDARGLAEVTAALGALTGETYPQAQRGLVGLTLLTQLVPRLLAPGPRLALDSFSLLAPEGPVRAQLSLAIPAQPGAGPSRDPATWLLALAGDGTLELPEAVARDWLARAGLPPGTDPRAPLRDWIAGGWVARDGGQVRSTLRLRDGLLTLNGRPLPILLKGSAHESDQSAHDRKDPPPIQDQGL